MKHLLFACLLISTATSAQNDRRYLKAYNCNCSVLTGTSIGAIQWFGACTDGYCDGPGTIFYYDLRGNYTGKFTGNISRGTRYGFGTDYYTDGSIMYRGRFKDYLYLDEQPFLVLNPYIRDFVVDSLLSGGINRSCDIVHSIFSEDGQFQEIWFQVSCDGQYDETNHYTCTLAFMNKSPYVDIVQASDNARVFILANFIRYAQRIYNWFEEQNKP